LVDVCIEAKIIKYKHYCVLFEGIENTFNNDGNSFSSILTVGGNMDISGRNNVIREGSRL
jgi:hypothetical protein